MIVKWHGLNSSTHDLPGGGPQGCTFGLLEYKSNSNDDANYVPLKMRFKFKFIYTRTVKSYPQRPELL